MEFPVLALLALPCAVVLLSTVRLRLQMGLFLLILSAACRPFPTNLGGCEVIPTHPQC